MNDDAFIRMFQERANAAGHDVGKPDGIAGPRTLAALDKVFPPLTVITPPPSKPLPPAMDNKLSGVHPVLVSIVQEAYERSPVFFTVSEGRRSKERQRELVNAGASKTMNSRHLTGHAVDLWPLDDYLKPLPSEAAFPKGSQAAKDASRKLWGGLRAISEIVKTIAKERGVIVTWGGDWGWDAPHFEINPSIYK